MIVNGFHDVLYFSEDPGIHYAKMETRTVSTGQASYTMYRCRSGRAYSVAWDTWANVTTIHLALLSWFQYEQQGMREWVDLAHQFSKAN